MKLHKEVKAKQLDGEIQTCGKSLCTGINMSARCARNTYGVMGTSTDQQKGVGVSFGAKTQFGKDGTHSLEFGRIISLPFVF